MAAQISNDSYLHLSITDFFVAIKTYTVRSPQDPGNPWAAGVSVVSGRKNFTARRNKSYEFVLEIPCDSQHVKNDSSRQSPRSQGYSVARAATASAKAIAELRSLCCFNCARQSTGHDQRKGLASRSPAGGNGCFLPAHCTWNEKSD